MRKMEALEDLLRLRDSGNEVSDASPAYESAKEDGARMGGPARRNKPQRLSHKLLEIRKRLQLSQTAMARALGLKAHYSSISNYELGTREPDLLLVLRYARLAGVPVEVLVDDQLSLPERLRSS